MNIRFFILAFMLCYLPSQSLGQTKKKASKKTNWQTHTSQNSLDWAGVYSGSLPCADCESIQTVIQLKANNTYIIQSKYIGKSNRLFEYAGIFLWNKTGNTIAMMEEGNIGDTSFALIGENKMTFLDKSQKKIEGNLAPFYILNKEEIAITERYWKLIELKGKPISNDSLSNQEPIHILLKKEGNRFSGSSGCNTIMGNYELMDVHKICFGQVASTMMACPNMELEGIFLAVLNQTKQYSISNNSLILYDLANEVLANFEVVYMK